MSDEYVRVRDRDLGYELSLRKSQVFTDAYDVLDGEDAVDAGGAPLPMTVPVRTDPTPTPNQGQTVVTPPPPFVPPAESGQSATTQSAADAAPVKEK